VQVLIAGGAGYIGSTIASACLDAGITPVIIDNLVTGRREFTEGRFFYEGGIEDGELIDRVFQEHPEINAVVLCAALINVPESVENPVNYYANNVSNSLSLVSHLIRHGCTRLVFSSSAATYRTGDGSEVSEDADRDPLSPYAQTKVVCEEMFEDIANAGLMRVLSLRYFNPIGADPKMRTGLQFARPSHALGKMISAMEEGERFEITGTDYPTRDGTGVRDYIHVWDLATAHLLALEKFDEVVSPHQRHDAINLGSGRGTTVRELIDAFNAVVEKPLAVREVPRRPGDNAGAYASCAKAERLLKWRASLSLTDGIRDSLRWAALRNDVLGK
jgi:UDP-glucose 4-epimerase